MHVKIYEYHLYEYLIKSRASQIRTSESPEEMCGNIHDVEITITSQSYVNVCDINISDMRVISTIHRGV